MEMYDIKAIELDEGATTLVVDLGEPSARVKLEVVGRWGNAC